MPKNKGNSNTRKIVKAQGKKANAKKEVSKMRNLNTSGNKAAKKLK